MWCRVWRSKTTASRVAACASLCALSLSAWAGPQVEAPLADSVRTALRAAVQTPVPPQPVLIDAAHRAHYQRWMREHDARLARWVDTPLLRQDLLQTVWYEAQRAALPPERVMGLIQVESAFRKFAISSADARGLMQVMPFWARLIGDGEVSRLFQLQVNLRFGCTILRHYLDMEGGDWFMALGRYNGSRGQSTYPKAVLNAAQAWALP